MGEDRGRTWRALVVAVHLAALAMISSEASAGPRFAASNGGQTVHDDLLHVTWLVNANLPKKRTYGLTININGSMNYLTALSWIYKLNTDNSGRGYLGHTTWTLPTQPTHDPSCTTQGPKPYHNRFAYNCTGSSFGSLYYAIAQDLKLQPGQSLVAMSPNQIGPFKNFQPYLYWSSTAICFQRGPARVCDYSTFSFETGWQGQNVGQHLMYVLPMLQGHSLGGTCNGGPLQPVANGQAVLDPITCITWAADANLAAAPEFNTTPGVLPDGAMSEETAVNAFRQALNTYQGVGYLHQMNWMVPPAFLPPATKQCRNFPCPYRTDPMGELFYRQLHLGQGQSAAATPDNQVGPFEDVQPYLYWACQGGDRVRTQTCGTSNDPPTMAESYSLGNGFLGTDSQINELFVTAYYPDEAQPGPLPQCKTLQLCCAVQGGMWRNGVCTFPNG